MKKIKTNLDNIQLYENIERIADNLMRMEIE